MSDARAPSAADLLAGVGRAVGDALDGRRGRPVAPRTDEAELRRRLETYDFTGPRPLEEVVADLLDLLQGSAVRSDHPRYFGLFNPPARPEAIAGDLVAAAVNPQLAVWSHAPAAAEIESKLVQLFGSWVWPGQPAAGSFTSGGSEANLTALAVALAGRYPDWGRQGLPRSGPRPAIFVSSEAHLAWVKIARLCGLGSDAVRLVPADEGLALSGSALERALAETDDTAVLVVATAGTTGHGAIDDLAGIAGAGRRAGAHVHVDAAWAGSLLIDPARRSLLRGVEQADSVTLDPHKWLAVPMGAGLYLGRSWTPLASAFGVRTSYMPPSSAAHRDPYVHSLQWSRRFIGARLFVALAAMGLDGYRAMIEKEFALGERLRGALATEGWAIANRTPLPLVCFTLAGATDETVLALEAAVVASGAAWISSVRLSGRLVLRACITSFETTPQDVDALVDALRIARSHVTGPAGAGPTDA